MNEIWKDIKNYEGYQVSNLGRVRTYNKTTYNEYSGTRHWKDKILKFKCQNENAYKTGYRVDLWKDGKSRTFLVSRLVAFTFYDKDINDKTLTVDHVDGNRFNNNINNLELVSLKENIQRSFETHLQPYDIVRLYNKNESKMFNSMSLASVYIGRSIGYISNVLKRNKPIMSSNGDVYYIEFISVKRQRAKDYAKQQVQH